VLPNFISLHDLGSSFKFQLGNDFGVWLWLRGWQLRVLRIPENILHADLVKIVGYLAIEFTSNHAIIAILWIFTILQLLGLLKNLAHLLR